MTQAVILAAGEGTRLRPHTLSRPKCLVPVGGKPLLHYQIDVLKSAGIEEIVVVGGYRAEQLAYLDITLRVNEDYKETNMVHSLFCADDLMQGDTLVSYGDIVFSRDVLDALLASDQDVSVVVDRSWEPYWRERFGDPLLDAETLRVHEGCIQEIGNPPQSLAEIEGQYIGLMRFSGVGIDRIRKYYAEASKRGRLGPRPVSKAYMTDLLQYAIDSGEPVYAVEVESDWVEIDTADDLLSRETQRRIERISASVAEARQ